MAEVFEVKLNRRAQDQIREASAFYQAVNLDLGNRFDEAVLAALRKLTLGWQWYQIRYADIRVLQV